MTRQEFVNSYGALIKKLSAETGMFPEIVLAQAFAEGGNAKGVFGESYTMKEGNNIFNIKASTGWPGATITNPYVRSESNVFRKYDSLADSIEDYFSFLTHNSRYKSAGVFTAHSAPEQAEALQHAGYAGSNTKYADLLMNIAKGAKQLLGSAKKTFMGAKDKAEKFDEATSGTAKYILLVAGTVGLLYFLNSKKSHE